MKPLIGITCNYDYKDTVGMTSLMGVPGQDWDFVAGDYIYAVERAGGLSVILPLTENFGTLPPLANIYLRLPTFLLLANIPSAC